MVDVLPEATLPFYPGLGQRLWVNLSVAGFVPYMGIESGPWQ